MVQRRKKPRSLRTEVDPNLARKLRQLATVYTYLKANRDAHPRREELMEELAAVLWEYRAQLRAMSIHVWRPGVKVPRQQRVIVNNRIPQVRGGSSYPTETRNSVRTVSGGLPSLGRRR